MKKLFIIIKHWVQFNFATPRDYPKGVYNPELDMMGIVVQLKNDPKKEEYEILRSGPISRGPMRQFSPSRSFLCRRPMFGYENSKERCPRQTNENI